jgi:glutathione synthase/RimK-type ligase-like ATP-grasp enzyme
MLEEILGMDKKTCLKTIEELNHVSILAAETLEKQFPNREYGIDFGIENGNAKFFEVNISPSIVGFSHLEDLSVWKQIVANRKAQLKGE